MKFKGTWLFSLLVVFAVAIAVWDYKRQQHIEGVESKASYLLPDFQMGSVASVFYKGPAGGFKIINEAGSWVITEPVEDQVDYESLEAFLQGIAEQDMADVPVSANVNWAQYGLDKPGATFDLSMRDGTNLKIEVGSERSYNDGYYVRKNSEPKLYLGSSSWTNYLSQSANDMRNKELYSGGGDYSSLEITEGSTQLKFNKVDGKWVSPQYKDVLISESSLSDYFNLVRHLRADAVVADVANKAAKKLYNLNRPAMTISVHETDGESKSQWQATFSRPQNNEVFVSIGSDRPVYRIQSRKMESLKKDISYFRDREYPFAVNHLNIPGFRLKRTVDKREFMFQKNSGSWSLLTEEPHKKVHPEGISALFNDLRGLKVKEFITGPEAKQKPKGKYGLVLLNAMGETTFEMLWGDEEKVNEDKRIKVWTTLAGESFWMGSDEIKEFEAHNILIPDGLAPQ